MNKKIIISFIFAIIFGVFIFIYSEFDDSPGGQLLGAVIFALGLVSLIKIKKKI